VDDSAMELTETVSLSLTAGTGYALGSPTSATGSIADNDAASLSVSDYTVTEGNTGTTAISIAITLSAPMTTSVTFSITTMGGTALAGNDYQTKTSTLTIKAGVTAVVFQVAIVNDNVAEPAETFTVTITSVSGAPVAKGTGTITIVDNDGMPSPVPVLTLQASTREARTAPGLSTSTASSANFSARELSSAGSPSSRRYVGRVAKASSKSLSAYDTKKRGRLTIPLRSAKRHGGRQLRGSLRRVVTASGSDAERASH
jgi:hypothetical protein